MTTRFKKTISIITISRNSSRSISKTITSVLSQAEGNFRLEYIIIDGASTDGTQDIVRSFSGAVDTFLSEPDTGISEAFNKGIALAHGEIIGIINSDDSLLPGALQKVSVFFNRHPTTDILHGDVLLYDNEVPVKKIKPPRRWWYPWRIILFNHPATFVKKEVYEKYGNFSLDYKYAMDADLFLRWVKAGAHINYLPEPLVRMQTGGLSGQFAYRGFAEKRRALLRNGFSSILVNIHFIGLCGAQIIVTIQTWLRRGRSHIETKEAKKSADPQSAYVLQDRSRDVPGEKNTPAT